MLRRIEVQTLKAFLLLYFPTLYFHGYYKCQLRPSKFDHQAHMASYQSGSSSPQNILLGRAGQSNKHNAPDQERCRDHELWTQII
uniref:Uncharacterized protein n=1 Tax=Rhizophora mucronata TaxID=61149 RepID=A0A2P2QMD2_RHIMU